MAVDGFFLGGLCCCAAAAAQNWTTAEAICCWLRPRWKSVSFAELLPLAGCPGYGLLTAAEVRMDVVASAFSCSTCWKVRNLVLRCIRFAEDRAFLPWAAALAVEGEGRTCCLGLIAKRHGICPLESIPPPMILARVSPAGHMTPG